MHERMVAALMAPLSAVRSALVAGRGVQHGPDRCCGREGVVVLEVPGIHGMGSWFNVQVASRWGRGWSALTWSDLLGIQLLKHLEDVSRLSRHTPSHFLLLLTLPRWISEAGQAWGCQRGGGLTHTAGLGVLSACSPQTHHPGGPQIHSVWTLRTARAVLEWAHETLLLMHAARPPSRCGCCRPPFWSSCCC